MEKRDYYDHDDKHAPVLPAPKVTDISPNGQSLSELAAIFWQWALRFDPATSGSPLNETNPLDCNLGIVGGGDVLVIGGIVSPTYQDTKFVTDPPRKCYLSKDIKAIFIPLLNAEEDSNPEGDLADLNQPGGWLRSTAVPNGRFRDLTKSVYLSVKSDGRDVHIPGWPQHSEHQTEFIKDNFYVVTPMFPLAGPRFSATEYSGPLLAASTGYYVLLDVEHLHFPLTVKFGGLLDLSPLDVDFTFQLDVTYKIYKN